MLFGFLTCGYLIKKKDGLNNTNIYMNIVLILMNNIYTITYIIQHMAKLLYGSSELIIDSTGFYLKGIDMSLYYIYLITGLISLSSVLVQYLWMPYISYIGLKNVLNLDVSKKTSILTINKVLGIFILITLFVLLLCSYFNNWQIYTRNGFFYTNLLIDNQYYLLCLIIIPLFFSSTYQIYAYRRVYNLLTESAKKTNRTNNKLKDIQKRCLIVLSFFLITYGPAIIDFCLISMFNTYLPLWFVFIAGIMTKLQSIFASIIILNSVQSKKSNNVLTSQSRKNLSSVVSTISVQNN